MDIKQNGDASVTLLARNVDEDVQVHLVLYQDGRMVANAIQDIAPWEGSRQVGLTLDEMPVGEYTYAVYLLQRDGLIPIAPKYEAAVCMDSRTSPAVLFASVK